MLWEPSESASRTSKRLPPRRPTHSLPGLVGRRLGAGLTQAELAARAGISRETLLRLEHGRPGTTESIARLAGALMVPIRVLTRDPKFDRHVTARFRTCSKCHQLKRLTRFTPIKGCRGYYGRCRGCRAEAAKQRYHSNEQARLADIGASQAKSAAQTKCCRLAWRRMGAFRRPARSGPDCLGHSLSVSPRTPCRRIANGDDPLREPDNA